MSDSKNKKTLYIIFNHDSGKNLLVDDEWMNEFDDKHGYSWSEKHERVEKITLGELVSLFRKYKKKYPRLYDGNIVPGEFNNGVIQIELETNDR